jgi:uncharacterized membrane protein
MNGFLGSNIESITCQPGQTTEIEITVTNSGTMKWFKNHKVSLALKKDDQSCLEQQFEILQQGIKPGESTVIKACFEAPAEPGEYTAVFKLNDLTKDIGKSISVAIIVEVKLPEF